MRIIKGIAATLLMSALCGSAFALTASQTVQKEVEITKADGTTEISYAPADLVAPGERIVYALNIENDGVQPATDLVLTMPVPDEIKYMEGSARKTGAVVTYSADNGQSFAARDSVTVVEGLVSRVAQSEDITHIRWKLAGPINAGEVDTLVFKGILK